jgi:hypothetical protein
VRKSGDAKQARCDRTPAISLSLNRHIHSTRPVFSRLIEPEEIIAVVGQNKSKITNALKSEMFL